MSREIRAIREEPTMSELLERCSEQENRYQFESFSQDQAKRLGDIMYRRSLEYDGNVAIEIRINHLVVYRVFPDGTNGNNELWLAAKARTVDMLGISTLHLFAEFSLSGETLADKRMEEKLYTRFGGGFPLTIRGTGVVGTICASGLPHMLDHQLIIDSLEEYFDGDLRQDGR